jgi:pimeloyl-ACP methyl ester carboxylesterase
MPWADLTDVRLYYELTGEGDPLVMIPGLGSTCRLWDPIVPELSRLFTLVMPDNRDVGKSKGKRAPRSLSDMAADLIELFDLLQLDRPHVMGISLGGVIAQCVAVEHPSRVNKLVLLSSAHRFGPYLRDISYLLGNCLYRMPYARFQRTIELLGTAPAYYDEHIEEVEQKIETARKAHASRKAVVRQLKCLAVSEVQEAHYRIDAPTLIVSGEYDALIPNCYAERMAAAIPGSEFHVLPDCGHNPISEMPAAVMPLITEFLLRMTHDGANAGKRFRDFAEDEAYAEVTP